MKPLFTYPGRLVLGGSVIAIAIALQWMFFVQQNRHARESRAWVQHTDQVLDTLENMFGKVRDSELGQRGFLITGFEEMLNPYRAAIGQPITSTAPVSMGNYDAQTIAQLLELLHRMLNDNPVQIARLNEMERLIEEKLAQSEELIQLRRDRGGEAAMALARIYHKQYLMKRIRIVLAGMVAVEEQLYKDRTVRDEATDATLNSFIVISAAAAYGLLLLFLVLVVLGARRARLAEQRLRLKEDHFRAVAESGLDAFFLFHAVSDAEGMPHDLILAYANPVAAQSLMMDANLMIGKPLQQVLPHDGLEGTEAYLDIFRHGLATQHEYSVVSGPWAGRSFQRQVIPLPDGIALICRDITVQKQMEQMKSEFVSTVSHELRTPLTSIRGSLGLILGGIAGPVAEQARGLLSIAHNNCERLVRLINDILDIEKIEAGSMSFHCRPVALLAFLRSAIETNEAYAAKYKVRFVLAAEGMEHAQISADPDRLMQVVTNLLSNAAKFSPEGGTVTLRCLQNGGRAQIEVEDHGSGIALPFQAGIFGRFVQGDASDTRIKGGTGLGLSIVKAMTERMQGQVDFESKEGVGSCFWISFPLLPLTERTVFLQSDPRPRILICEDDADVAQFLSLVLDRAGFASDIAASAAEAMWCLNAQAYAAMTLDLMLPDAYGMELLATLRADPKSAHLPIVVVSARAEQEQGAGHAGGVLDWITKPIDTGRLVSHMRALIGGKARPRLLHVEDDDSISEVLRLALPEADVVRVANLGDARALIGQGQAHYSFDLVVLDVGLPDGAGTELLPLLQQYPQSVPVMLFTASDVSPGIRATVDASLVKSRTSDEVLIETIRTLITQKAAVSGSRFTERPL